METGRLQPSVRERALELIGRGGDVARWEDENPPLAPQRRKVLDRLATKLVGPQSTPKRLRRRRVHNLEFDIGDVVLLRNDVEASAALVVVVAHRPTRRAGVWPLVEVLLWDEEQVPTKEELERLPALLEPDFAPHELRPAAFVVGTTSAPEAFGPHLGEIVARGVQRVTPNAEPIPETGKVVAEHVVTWPSLSEWVGTDAYRRARELTASLLA